MFEAVFDLAKAVVPVNCHLLLLNLLRLEGEKITLQQMKGGGVRLPAGICLVFYTCWETKVVHEC